MAENKISPYNLNDLKNTTDDALGNYLRGLSFKQDNFKLDVRLAIGYVSVVIAGAIFAADYKLGWEATKTWTAAAVTAYAILQSAFTYWTWAVEKGLVFEGSKNGRKISIYSKSTKHDPTYYLEIIIGSSNPKQISTPFTTWFTADGYFVAKPFQQWLASSIEIIGDEDMKNAGRDERDHLAAPGIPAGKTNGSATGVDTSKGTRRSKKA